MESTGTEYGTADNTKWAYELDDGAPVSACLHGQVADAITGMPEPELGSASAAIRRPFGDVTSNFAEFYAFAYASDMKSPDTKPKSMLGLRFSPNRPPGSAAKRLWSTELPPLPRPAGGNARITASVLAPVRAHTQPQDGSSSPTRHSTLATGGPAATSDAYDSPTRSTQPPPWGAPSHPNNNNKSDLRGAPRQHFGRQLGEAAVGVHATKAVMGSSNSGLLFPQSAGQQGPLVAPDCCAAEQVDEQMQDEADENAAVKPVAAAQ
ncbi:hypothetical protein Agub_g2743 [Astrephomene gubernaculifera]|uniref:Uncharacterized protein n=1 Tax=Astrephomene gubernaculifera TaxID=47775 RepID=A0AAD3DJP4_9CHLO|nr:hypothetical protein Agub_g2743 [Astrephomene gubernaculifera]